MDVELKRQIKIYVRGGPVPTALSPALQDACFAERADALRSRRRSARKRDIGLVDFWPAVREHCYRFEVEIDACPRGPVRRTTLFLAQGRVWIEPPSEAAFHEPLVRGVAEYQGWREGPPPNRLGLYPAASCASSRVE